MTIDPAELTAKHAGCLPELLGMRFTEATRDRLVAELAIRDDLKTVGGRLHGGAIMAFADTVAATATRISCRASSARRRPSSSCGPPTSSRRRRPTGSASCSAWRRTRSSRT